MAGKEAEERTWAGSGVRPLSSGLAADPTGRGYGSEVRAGLSAVLLLRYSMTRHFQVK
jgi:hypothetical protein